MQITLNDIGKKYGDHWIFRHFSAHFQSDRIYGVTGSNGSGKSTLLQVISGFVTPNQGEITFQHKRELLPLETWYKHLSIAAPYQDLFEEFTVLESIELHQQLKPLAIASANDLLTELALADHKNKALNQLSSGMKQRLKLALALYSNVDVVLLDEPCSNLDQRWINWYNETVLKRSSGRITIICSNSQPEELKHCNEAIIDISVHPRPE